MYIQLIKLETLFRNGEDKITDLCIRSTPPQIQRIRSEVL